MEEFTRNHLGCGKTVANGGAATKKRRFSSRNKFVSPQDPTLGGEKYEFPAKEGGQPSNREPDASPKQGGGEVPLDVLFILVRILSPYLFCLFVNEYLFYLILRCNLMNLLHPVILNLPMITQVNKREPVVQVRKKRKS